MLVHEPRYVPQLMGLGAATPTGALIGLGLTVGLVVLFAKLARPNRGALRR